MSQKKSNILFTLKLVGLSYVLTGIFILIFTLIVYKNYMADEKIIIGVLAIYTISNAISGFIAGRIKQHKKYIWGAITGITYFIVLILISFIVTKEFLGNTNMIMPAFLATVCGGTIGGMLS